ncbi:hypothetical protein ACOSQ2_024947 [Xanthoceras sorbifolium]
MAKGQGHHIEHKKEKQENKCHEYKESSSRKKISEDREQQKEKQENNCHEHKESHRQTRAHRSGHEMVKGHGHHVEHKKEKQENKCHEHKESSLRK